MISRRRILAGAVAGATLLVVPREVLTPARPASATTEQAGPAATATVAPAPAGPTGPGPASPAPAPGELEGASAISSSASYSVIVESLSYERGLTATVYRPAVRTAHPVIYFLHGGFWESGTRHQYDREAQVWAQRGWVAVTLDYSLGTGTDYQAQVDDVWAGVTMTEVQWYCDPQRQVLFGDSAGGHLAALVAVQHPEHFRGQILWSPVVSPLNAYRDNVRAGAGRGRLSQAARRVAGIDWAGADPSRQVTPRTPPAWIAASTAEFVTYAKQGKLLAEALGDRADVHLVRGTRHGKSLQHGSLLRDARAWARDHIA